MNLLIGLIDVPYINQFLFICQICTWQTHLFFFCWWLLMIWVSHQMNGSYKSLVKKNWSRYILVLATAAVIFCLFRFCKLFILTIVENHIRTMYKYLFCSLHVNKPSWMKFFTLFCFLFKLLILTCFWKLKSYFAGFFLSNKKKKVCQKLVDSEFGISCWHVMKQNTIILLCFLFLQTCYHYGQHIGIGRCEIFRK